MLMPRETPLSAIHLRNMLTLREAGATILFLAPGFYHGAETVDDLVDFIVARASTCSGSTCADPALGPDVTVESGPAAGRRRPADVRPDRAGLRRDEPRHDRRPRPALAPGDRRERPFGPATTCSTPAAARAISPIAARNAGASYVVGVDFSERMLERAGARQPSSSGCSPTCSSSRSRTRASTRPSSASGSGTSRTSKQRSGAAARAPARRPARDPRDHDSRAARSQPFYKLWFDRVVPLLGRLLPGGDAYTYLPASVRRFPGPEELASCSARAASRPCGSGALPGVSWPCT